MMKTNDFSYTNPITVIESTGILDFFSFYVVSATEL